MPNSLLRHSKFAKLSAFQNRSDCGYVERAAWERYTAIDRKLFTSVSLDPSVILRCRPKRAKMLRLPCREKTFWQLSV